MKIAQILRYTTVLQILSSSGLVVCPRCEDILVLFDVGLFLLDEELYDLLLHLALLDVVRVDAVPAKLKIGLNFFLYVSAPTLSCTNRIFFLVDGSLYLLLLLDITTVLVKIYVPA